MKNSKYVIDTLTRLLEQGLLSSKDLVDELMNICKNNKGICKLIFHLPNENSSRPLKVLAHNILVSSSSNFLILLRSKYGKDNVWID